MQIVQQNIPLKKYTTLRLDATARYFVDIVDSQTVDDLPEIFAFIRENSLPYVIIGGGSNVVFACDVYDGIVIRMAPKGWELDESLQLTAMAGEVVTPLVVALDRKHHLPIMDRWMGLPGTIGGAVVGNAWCFGLDTAKYFHSARVYNVDNGEFETLSKADMKFDYRTSILKSDRSKLVVSATFDLSRDLDPDRYRDGVEFRQLKQPKGFTCGSFFKNPYPYYAGKLIDDAGLKWTRIGGAEISERHGNFFLNVDNANWRDIIALRDLAKTTVREKYGIDLEEEVRIITNPVDS